MRTGLTFDDLPEFIGQILDGFEDFLEEKGVVIENPEKQDSEDPAILYGSDYGRLYSRIEETLILWKAVRE